jgi:FtsP/CotA-like multicopper oxidase with cupredoxin domain
MHELRTVSWIRTTAVAAGAVVLLGLPGCGGGGGGGGSPLVEETFREPAVLSSKGGELRARLEVAERTIEVDGTLVTTTIYNGQYVPPVLRLKPGDTLFLQLANLSPAPTNEHFHGLNVSPRINPDATVSDNVFVHIEPGRTLDYKVNIPSSHNPGLYWYHSHQHGSSEQQVMGGLSGGMVIEGLLDPIPQLAGIRERVLLLKDIQIGPDGRVPDDIDSSAPTHRTVNGQTNPTLSIAPGEIQLLRIGNISANMYYRLKLPGHRFHELARDGNRHNRLVVFDELLLPPASRSEVLIQGGAAGSYELKSLAIDTGPQGDTAPETTLMTVVSQGLPRIQASLPEVLPAVEDFRTLPVARRRTITFQESADGNSFYIDSGNGPVQFDPNRVDSTIESGTVEEWTILNPTGEWHVFHIHQTDFQVTEINGVAQPFTGHQDNVNVDYQADASSPPGQVKLLIDFRNPLIVGKFVYHCHILEHEDGGMMAVAEVQPSALLGSAPAATPGWWNRSGGAVERWLATFRSGAETEAQARREAELAAAQAASLCRTDTPPAALEAAESAAPGQPPSKAAAPVSARNISLVTLRPQEPMR